MKKQFWKSTNPYILTSNFDTHSTFTSEDFQRRHFSRKCPNSTAIKPSLRILSINFQPIHNRIRIHRLNSNKRKEQPSNKKRRDKRLATFILCARGGWSAVRHVSLSISRLRVGRGRGGSKSRLASEFYVKSDAPVSLCGWHTLAPVPRTCLTYQARPFQPCALFPPLPACLPSLLYFSFFPKAVALLPNTTLAAAHDPRRLFNALHSFGAGKICVACGEPYCAAGCELMYRVIFMKYGVLGKLECVRLILRVSLVWKFEAIFMFSDKSRVNQ